LTNATFFVYTTFS